jgi:malonate-semialdehyde dehydrogenase (acetylating)/methylmalonate-semialdehyde dehydrogenase
MSVLQEVKSHYGHLRYLIGGEWVESKSTDIRSTVNPATGKEIATYPVATEAEARMAVEAAQRGFKAWRDVCLRDKGRLLHDLRQKMEENFDVLTRVLTQDHGRTIGESRGSVRRCIENVEAACAALYAMPKLNEHIDELANGIDEWMIYEPKGVFLIITPSNIPMHAWSSFVPFALASGCSVVVSPSTADPVAGEYIEHVLDDLGLPPGTVNMIHGGRKINEYILRQPEVRGVGFIGSTAVGQDLFRLCGELGKDSSLNGSGKNMVVIMPDADMDQAVTYLMSSCFGMGGQRCLGSDIIVTVGDAHRQVREKFSAVAKAVKLGYGLDESTKLGPLVNRKGVDNVLAWIEGALNDGCSLVVDGRNPRVEGGEQGFFLAPTILEGAGPGMANMKVEAFGPVATLMQMDSLDQVIEWHNQHNYDLGHSACIMTQSGKYARKFVKEVETGNVGVNVAIPQPYSFFPLGSKKQSFLGMAKSRYASIRLFLDEKTVTARWV